MSRRLPPVQLSSRQRTILERLSRSRTLPKRLSERVAFVLGAAAGKTAVELTQQAGLDPQRARRWRKRWLKACEQLDRAETEPVDDDALEILIRGVLADGPRSGTPSKFSQEQLAQIMLLACKTPSEVGVPVTHWTPSELAREAAKTGIVESISPRHLARFL